MARKLQSKEREGLYHESSIYGDNKGKDEEVKGEDQSLGEGSKRDLN